MMEAGWGVAIFNRIEKFNHLSKHFSRDLKEMRELLFMQKSGARLFWAEGSAGSKALKEACLEEGGWWGKQENCMK